MATGRWRAAVTNDFVVTKHEVAKTVTVTPVYSTQCRQDARCFDHSYYHADSDDGGDRGDNTSS